MIVFLLNEDFTFSIQYQVPSDPMEEGNFLYPSVPFMRIAPPTVSDNQVAVAENPGTEQEKWVIKSDLRGTDFWIGSVKHTINAIGETVPQGAYTEPPAVVPYSISTAQGHLALIEYGKYQAAVDYINAIPDATQKLIAEVNFYRRNDWQRDNETLLSLSTALGISNAELDQMFIYGSTR